MLLKLFLLFSVIPLIELAILIEVGRNIGVLYTVILVAGTGALGAFLARHQGFKVTRRIKDSLNRGEIPADELIGGLLILAGGLMLLTPGLLTDIAGFSMIIPYTRCLYVSLIRKKFSGYVRHTSQFSFRSGEAGNIYDSGAVDYHPSDSDEE